MTKRNLFTIYENDMVELTLEVVEGLPYLHCTVTQWSKESYNQFMEEWIGVLEQLKAEGIDYLFTWSPDKQSAKFARMFGFKTLLEDEAGQALSFMRY